jgi:hypothetical protein
LRARFLVEEHRPDRVFSFLAEDCFLAAFNGELSRPTWLEPSGIEPLVRAEPTVNIDPGQARHWLSQVLAARPSWWPAISVLADRRAQEHLQAHRRVRSAARLRGVRYSIKSHDEVDLLGFYVLMPDLRTMS